MSNLLSDVSKKEIDDFYIKIGNNVKNQRLKANLSQLELSLSIGIKSIAFYSNCENYRYRKHFNLEHLYKIAKVLKIKVSDLID